MGLVPVSRGTARRCPRSSGRPEGRKAGRPEGRKGGGTSRGRCCPSTRVRHQGGGRRRIDDRVALAAILYVLDSGCAWNELPESFPISSASTHRRGNGPRSCTAKKATTLARRGITRPTANTACPPRRQATASSSQRHRCDHSIATAGLAEAPPARLSWPPTVRTSKPITGPTALRRAVGLRVSSGEVADGSARG
ncbi:transposase [Actinoplanes sp. NPDC051470]|uniref:transposase n=1 Tax=Actinoplanes sp. NPDC051470 TaxID=3157224 RepID=UPI0034277D26